MRQKFAIGQELDLLSSNEFERGLSQTIRAIIGLREPPTVMRPTIQFSADGAGNVGAGADIPAYKTPPGCRAIINRWLLEATGFTPAAPLNVGFLYARRGSASGDPVVFWPGSGSTVAPSLWVDGRDSGVRLGEGEGLVITGSGFAANQAFLLHLQLILIESPANLRGEPVQRA